MMPTILSGLQINRAARTASFEELVSLSYLIPKKWKRSLHTCVQDVRITRTVTI
jgi:hypothetical protein